MFSTGHLIWIGISVVLIVCGLTVCQKKKPSIRKVLSICMIIGIISEIIKIFAVAEIVPLVDPEIVQQNGNAVIRWLPSGEYTPYLGMEHLPLELCSIYLLLMFLALVLKDGKWKQAIYAVMFASGTLGGIMGIVMSAIAGYYSTPLEYFLSVRVWQFFLFHSMIVTCSLYIGFSKESALVFSDWKKAMAGLVILDIPSFYLNSVLSSEVYFHGELVGVTHRINLFSSYVNPLGLILTEKWQWITYLLIRGALATGLVVLLYCLLNFKKKEQPGR